MFTAFKKGPPSILRAARTGFSFCAVINKSSPLYLSLQPVQKSTRISRWLSTSSQTQYYGGAQAARNRSFFREEEEIIPTTNDQSPYTKFQEIADAGLVHPTVIRDITHGLGHETMTTVQARTIIESLKGTDIIAQARTGTGKTLGFLIPVVQNIIKNNPELAEPSKRMNGRAQASDIRGIIISPTRELAEQITVEARKLTRSTGVIVQAAVGGNSKTSMLRQMQREGCHLLVATPGRLNDLLTDPYSKVEAPDLSTLVLDEADRLLDAGFADDIQDIIHLLPDRSVRDRQTMLFSATVPREVMGLVRRTLKPDFQFVQTIQKGEMATHEKIPQKLVELAGIENTMPALVELCKREIATRMQSPDSMPFKAIVYFNCTASVELASLIIENMRSSNGKFGPHPLVPAQIFEMHGKLKQERRTYVSDGFRRAKSAIMLSSDVTARGMDFPNVTHVIQIGMPGDSDVYIHRIGRTGRAGKEGEGWLLMTRPEVRAGYQFLRNNRIVPDNSLEAASVDMTREAQLPADLAETLSQVGNATKMAPRSILTAAYLATITTLRTIRDKQLLVDLVNQWTKFGWGWESPPAITARMMERYQLRGVRGMTVEANGSDGSDFGRGENNYGRGARRAFVSSGRDRDGRGSSSFGGGGRGGQSLYEGYLDRNRGDQRGSSRYNKF